VLPRTGWRTAWTDCHSRAWRLTMFRQLLEGRRCPASLPSFSLQCVWWSTCIGFYLDLQLQTHVSNNISTGWNCWCSQKRSTVMARKRCVNMVERQRRHLLESVRLYDSDSDTQTFGNQVRHLDQDYCSWHSNPVSQAWHIENHHHSVVLDLSQVQCLVDRLLDALKKFEPNKDGDSDAIIHGKKSFGTTKPPAPRQPNLSRAVSRSPLSRSASGGKAQVTASGNFPESNQLTADEALRMLNVMSSKFKVEEEAPSYIIHGNDVLAQHNLLFAVDVTSRWCLILCVTAWLRD